MNTSFSNHSSQQAQMLFGIRALIEAVKSGKDIEAVYIQRGLSGELFNELRHLLKGTNINYQLVPVEKLNRITRKNHQGVIGLVSQITYQNIEDIIPQVYERGEVPLVLILDGIKDVRNMGAIARTAECAGVHAIVVPVKESAQINADTIKTSAGALFKIPVCRHDSLQKVVSFLTGSGLQTVCCTEKTNDSLYQVNYTSPTAIIMGSEESGISNELLRSADYLAKIPMFGQIASLNVSVSAGIILYEAIRQREDF